MIERALSKTDIRTLLDRLSERLREKRAFAKIHVVGSACIALPRYEFEQTGEGLTLTVQEAQDTPPKVLGKKLSLHTLALRERTHRGWPVEATDVIMQFTESEITRRRTLSR